MAHQDRNTFDQEVAQGQRFEFGKNWRAFLSSVNDDRIEIAACSLRELLGTDSLAGTRFLDVGSGSGLFSLAARRLGATVHSFDHDPTSVACAQELRARFRPDDRDWTVARGSVLDQAFLRTLGDFDVVYSWGVLHHTGRMWAALDNVGTLVRKGGLLAVAIYNDQGARSRWWLNVKRLYCSSAGGRVLVSGAFLPYYFLKAVALSIGTGKNTFAAYKKNRGMSIVHDWLDWLGGFPYEVAKAEDVVRFFGTRGFQLRKSTTTTGLGNNEFAFLKE